MDAITQIQGYVNTMPKVMKESIESLSTASLSVGEAHAIAQLADTGFVGIQGVTSVVPPVPLEALQKFRATAEGSIEQARLILQKAAEVDAIMASLPADLCSEQEQLEEMKLLGQVYEDAAERLRKAENEARYYQHILTLKTREITEENFNIRDDIQEKDL